MPMKTSSAQPDRRPLSRSKAWVCAVINQLAFPGMGTVMAGRRSGYVQAAVMVAGFLLTMGFMFVFFAALIQSMVQGVGSDTLYKQLFHHYGWAGLSGLGLWFLLTMGFMFVFFAALIQSMVQGVGSDTLYKQLFHHYGWAGLSGLALCFIAWCWSLVSSIIIVRSAPPSA